MERTVNSPDATRPEKGARPVDIQCWARWFARGVDAIVFLPVSIAVFRLLPHTGDWFAESGLAIVLNNPFGGRLATGFVGVALYLVFEPLLLSNVGATLGKWIMGVRVRTTNGDNVSYLVGLRRTISVATLGLAWGVPVIAQIAMFLGMSRVVKNKPTFWDEWAGTVVEHRKRPFWLWATTIVVVLGLNVGLTMVSRVME